MNSADAKANAKSLKTKGLKTTPAASENDESIRIRTNLT